MTINTKFNIGDTVWFSPRKPNIFKGVVKAIQATTYINESFNVRLLTVFNTIEYEYRGVTTKATVEDMGTCSTKEELIDFLNKL